MKAFFGFIIGYFISIFATHNFGWEATVQSGGILLSMGIFFHFIITQIKTKQEENK